MKKLIILTLFLSVTILGISQPVVNRSANSITVVDARLGGGLNLYTPKYADTTEANLTANRGIDSSGALIYTRNDKKVWIRKHNPKIWIEIGAASAAIDSVLYATRARVQKGIDSVAAVSQPLDADLTTIAGLTATTNNFIVSSSSAWASRTPTQVKTTLAIANTDVSGLGTLSTQNGTFSGTSSGTNTGDETTSRINALYGYTPANGANYFPIAGGSLTGTTNTGYVGFLAQTTAMVAPTEGFKLYDSSGFTLLRADGFRRVLSFSGLTANVKYNFPVGTTNDTVTTNIAPQTLTNKTISGSANAITGIAESSITNLTSDLATKATKAGEAGGQTINGGTLTTQNLTLQPNAANTTTGSIISNGKIIFGTDNSYDIGASGATRPKDIWVAGKVNVTGEVQSASNVQVALGKFFYWNTGSVVSSPSNSIITLSNFLRDNFDRLQFGGTTSSFPALKRSSADLLVKDAADGVSSGFGVGVSSINASAVSEISSTTKGVLLPRMTTTQRDAISSPAEGLEIYNLTTHTKNFYNGTVWKAVITD